MRPHVLSSEVDLLARVVRALLVKRVGMRGL